MEFEAAPSRLSRIETLWSVVKRSHEGDEQSLIAAQQKLLDLYGSAIKRYLLAAVRDPDVADELFQEFAFKFIKGDFQSADPAKGRFRSFVKTILARMVALHFRKLKSRKEQALGDDTDLIDGEAKLDDTTFIVSWREELLSRTWQALADWEAKTGKHHDTVLRLRVAHPTLSSSELAERISAEIGKETTPGAARVMVHRAREKFAHVMIDVVADSLDSRDPDEIESELIDLGLIDYCQAALSQLQDPTADMQRNRQDG